MPRIEKTAAMPHPSPSFFGILLERIMRGYQIFISPAIPSACRFTPSCSDYAREAFLSHGAWRGGIMTLKRLLRCHPWGGAGLDPVLEKQKRKP